MKVREAKDFLVQQIAEQALLDDVPLSDLEKRMLYFTEGRSAVEDPVALNEEFEAQYDTAKFEKKISKLMYHAYKRLRNDGSASLMTWNEAIRCLKRGDHYLLVMWDSRPGIHGTELIGIGLGLSFLALIIGLKWIAHYLPAPNPRYLQAMLIAIIIAGIFFRSAINNAFGWLMRNTLDRFIGKEDEE